MTTREKLARELFSFIWKAPMSFDECSEKEQRRYFREADRIIKLLKGGEK